MQRGGESKCRLQEAQGKNNVGQDKFEMSLTADPNL